MMRIKEVADLVGISKRALQHYDQIGLLSPGKTNSGYRMYSVEDLDRLQQILFFKELGFSLKEIQKIINSPSFNQEEALKMHRKMLTEKNQKIYEMIMTIDRTLQYKKGVVKMTNKDKFKGFDFSLKNPYEKEARERWGNKAVDESKKRIQGKEEEMSARMNDIFWRLADLRHLAPDSYEAQKAIQEWYDFLNYPLEAFRGLGEMYVMDQRFTENIDQFGEGLAKFMNEAMKEFANRNR